MDCSRDHAVHLSSGGLLVPAVGTSSCLLWLASGACCRDQFIPLLVDFWCLLSGPVHPCSGGPLVPAVGTSSSLFWWTSGACCRDQFIPLLVDFWCLLSGPVHPSSSRPLVPAVGTSPYLFWYPLRCPSASITMLSANPIYKR